MSAMDYFRGKDQEPFGAKDLCQVGCAEPELRDVSRINFWRRQLTGVTRAQALLGT